MKIDHIKQFGAGLVLAVVGAGAQGAAFDALTETNNFGYSGTEISNSIRDIRSTGTQINLGDDQLTSPLSLGFNFDFFGNTYTDTRVSSNGFMQFTAPFSQGCCSGQELGNGAGLDNLIGMMWDDLDSNGNTTGTMWYESSASAFTVGFYDVNHFPSGSPVTFEVTLYEGSNDIELQFGNVDPDGSAHTIGLTNIGDDDALVLANSRSLGEAEFDNRGFLFSAATVPEPSTLAALGLGLLVLGGLRRKRS